MFAVFKRDFIAYFLNPTGYVFICVFVLLGSIAAFLPDDFVNANLANLACLDRWFPLIMLIFVPAVTMGIWSDEKRYGTEELLLTSPLSIPQIVFGKYMAIVGVYTVALFFSAGSNWWVLDFLGDPDPGLFVATVFGYWLVGLPMLAFGMAASFLTSQPSIAYILGGLFNLPWVALQWADAAPLAPGVVRFLQNASPNTYFQPAGRGLVTLSTVLYFTLIPLVVLGACLLLAGRHRRYAQKGLFFAAHDVVRLGAATVLVAAIVGIVRLHDVRIDWTAEKLSTLSPTSRTLIVTHRSEWPVVIDAYLSQQLPAEYAKTRLDIIAVLNEISDRMGPNAFLTIHPTEPNTPMAVRLERQYDIRPKKVVFNTRGRLREEEVFLTVIFRSGPKTAVIPFLNRGLSVEYELVASLAAVGDAPRKKIGVLKTDAALFGKRDGFGNLVMKPWPIIEELSRHYTVVEIDPSEPIAALSCDLFLAVQPSSLSPAELMNFSAVVRVGCPVLIFEDPYPLFASYLAGTRIPRPPNPRTGFSPKGDIAQLWSLLGILFSTDVLWKNYNPYPSLAVLSEEFLFVDAQPISFSTDSESPSPNETSRNKKTMESFAPHEAAVSPLERMLFPFAGWIVPDNAAGTLVAPLIRTEAGGSSAVEKIAAMGMQSRALNRSDRPGNYTLAAKINGPIPRMFRRSEEMPPPELNVMLVADVDCITPGFFGLREAGLDAQGATLDFDNVTFLLNAVDQLAGDESLISVRSRRMRHRTLTTLEEATRSIRDRAAMLQIAAQKEFERECRQEEERLNGQIAEMVNRGTLKNGADSPELDAAVQAMQQRLSDRFAQEQAEYTRRTAAQNRQVEEYVRTIQGRYKFYAVFLPPLFPLAIGLTVFLARMRFWRKDKR